MNLKVWLTSREDKMNQILGCDGLPEEGRWWEIVRLAPNQNSKTLLYVLDESCLLARGHGVPQLEI